MTNHRNHKRRSTAAIWTEVGRKLRARRQELALSAAAVTKRGGPTYKTVLKTERGGAARIDLLETHAAALGILLVDVLTAVVKPGSFSPEASSIARAYDSAPPVGQSALREVARIVGHRTR